MWNFGNWMERQMDRQAFCFHPPYSCSLVSWRFLCLPFSIFKFFIVFGFFSALSPPLHVLLFSLFPVQWLKPDFTHAVWSLISNHCSSKGEKNYMLKKPAHWNIKKHIYLNRTSKVFEKGSALGPLEKVFKWEWKEENSNYLSEWKFPGAIPSAFLIPSRRKWLPLFRRIYFVWIAFKSVTCCFSWHD